jgi:hypothetical protein
MKIVQGAFLFFLLIPPVWGDVVFTWTLPDIREDGSQLLLEEISHVTLYVSKTTGENTITDFDIHADTYTGVYPPGEYSAHMTCTDILGLTSEDSPTVQFMVEGANTPTSKPHIPNLIVNCDGYQCSLIIREAINE